MTWLSKATGGAAPSAVARAAGVPTSTITRSIERKSLSPEIVVKVGRAYGAPILDGLVACGLLTEEEAALPTRVELGIPDALARASDYELVVEMVRRIDDGSSLRDPNMLRPLNESHPAVQQVAQKRRERGAE